MPRKSEPNAIERAIERLRALREKIQKNRGLVEKLRDDIAEHARERAGTRRDR